MKYHAFISYSHRDRAWGDWLHKALEGYVVPKALVGRDTDRGAPVPARLYPVFRDREELPTAVDLGSVITQALEQSRYLIVICSPNSARSEWVNQEIINYKRLGRENRVLAIIVDGEPNAAEGKPGFTAGQECFPPALKYRLGPQGQLSTVRTEPIAADARPHADGRANALLKLIAGVLGVNYDDLRRRDEEFRRRRQRRILALSTALTLVFACLALISVWQWRVAVERRQVAETRLYHSSLALAHGALREGHVELARKALWRAPVPLRNWEWGYLLRKVHPTLISLPMPAEGYTEASWVSEDGTRWGLLLGTVFEYSRISSGGRLVTRSIELPESPHVDVSPDGRRLLVCAEGKVSVWDIEEGRCLRQVPLPDDTAWVDAWFWDRNGNRIFLANEDQGALRDSETGEALWTLSGEGAATRLLAVSRTGLALAFNPLSGQGGLLDSRGRWLARLEGLHGANHASFSSDGKAAVLMTGDGGVWDIDILSSTPVWRALQPQQADRSDSNRMPSHAVFTGGGDTLWFISRHRLYTFERASGELAELALPSGFVPTQLCAGQDQVAVGTDHGLVAFYTIKGEQLISQGLAHEGAVIRLAGIAVGAGRWASLGQDGALQFWARPDEFSLQPLSTAPGFSQEHATTGQERALLVNRLGPLYSQVLAAHQGSSEPRLTLNSTGERLLSAGNDGLVRLWSVPDHELLLSIEAPAPLVEEARFSADGLRLGVSASPRGASFPFFTLWSAEDWRSRPWLTKPYAEDDEAEAYKAWQRRNFRD